MHCEHQSKECVLDPVDRAIRAGPSAVLPEEPILMARLRAVLKAGDKKSGCCYRKAREAKARASKALSTEARKFYLEAEARWLCLAASFEHAERLADVVERLSALPKMPFCPACDTPMQPDGVGLRAGLMEYHYECATCGAQRIIVGIDRTTTS